MLAPAAGRQRDGLWHVVTGGPAQALPASHPVRPSPSLDPTLSPPLLPHPAHRPHPNHARTRTQSNSAQLMWSPSGVAVLALAASDVDATNQSYYGEQKLFFLAADGKNECAVPLAKVRARGCGAGVDPLRLVSPGFFPCAATLGVPTHACAGGPRA